MKTETFRLKDDEGIALNVYRWSPDAGKPKACVQISHGLGEHAGRYNEVAERLCTAGWEVWADDHRGHGLSAEASGGRGNFGPGGWDAVVRGLRALSDRIAAERPGLPLVLVGHSWGSYLSQDYAQRWGSRLAGLVLVGSAGSQSFVVARLGPLILALGVAFTGPDRPSEISHRLSFMEYNKPYLPSPTGTDSDWISRDAAEVRKCATDPLCDGFRLTNQASLEFTLAMNRIWRPERESLIPVTLPVLVLSGTDDVVSARLATLKPLVERWRARGFADLETKYYEGARHDVFHETNRAEVIGDLSTWIGRRLSTLPAKAANN